MKAAMLRLASPPVFLDSAQRKVTVEPAPATKDFIVRFSSPEKFAVSPGPTIISSAAGSGLSAAFFWELCTFTGPSLSAAFSFA
eukprot:CAMPEP_0115077542 /NCGR_PEP_ID=MMETSP0227-20121206/17047_1 /TAXON_ID=89957 /ORGANISM="Polarella glacialis, Strain CCMP 1383" /LENGTH=83 /DNA_ID=CAMNT_0002464819 /DNA_START=96 /DNA_END=347 /DNA_ORIENTATION=+